MRIAIMERTLRIFIGFLLIFLGHISVARAALPIVVAPSALDKPKLTITLPAGIKYCATADSEPKPTVQLEVAALRAGTTINVAQDGDDCTTAAAEAIHIAALEVDLVSAKVRVDTRSAQLILSLAEGQTLHPEFANAWFGGTEIIGLTCSSNRCTAPLPGDLDFASILSYGQVAVTVAHDSSKSIHQVSGQAWSPTLRNLDPWQLPAGADLHRVTLHRKGDKLQSEFSLDVPYWFLFEEGPFKCEGQADACGRLVASASGPPSVIIESPAVVKKLSTTNGAVVKLEFQVKGGTEYTTGTLAERRKTFSVSVSSEPCTFQVNQLTPVSRGVKGAQVLLQISPVTSDACAMGSWSVASPNPMVGVIVGSLRRFDAFEHNLHVIEVDTTAGDRDGTLPLTFMYPDGTAVDTGAVEIRVDGRVPVTAPLIWVNTEVEDTKPEVFKEYEITDTIAQSRSSLIQFRQLSDPSRWRLRLPAGVQAAACYQHDGDPANLVRHESRGEGNDQWSGFCVDVERSSARTIDFTLERRGQLGDLLDKNDPNYSTFEKLHKRELYLGTALEAVQVKQAPFSVKVELLPRVRLVCQGDVGSPATAEIRAFRHSALQQCNLYIELEEGALDELEGRLPRRNWKGNIPKVAHARAEKQRVKAVAENKTWVNACEDGSRPDFKAEQEKIEAFHAQYGQQKLKVNLLELGENGEFQAVPGSENVIRIKSDRVDSGAYPQRIQGGVLAVCVDLTHQGRAARKAYDVVKITVDHDDAFYEVAWQDDQAVEFSAKVRRMPALGSNFGATTKIGPRFYFSLAIPTLIRYPSTGRESETSSGFQFANAVSFQAGVVAGMELWNFNENRPMSPVFNPQLFVGTLLVGLPTQGNPSPLMPSFIYGLGFRLPSGDDASKAVEASTSILLWGEYSSSARREWVTSVLFGFNVSIGFFGS